MYVSKCKIIARKQCFLPDGGILFAYALESDRGFEIAYDKSGDYKVGQGVTVVKSKEDDKWKTKIC